MGVFQNVGLDSDAVLHQLTLLQAALMVFILDTAIGVGVWVPFTIGKSTALLSVSRGYRVDY